LEKAFENNHFKFEEKAIYTEMEKKIFIKNEEIIRIGSGLYSLPVVAPVEVSKEDENLSVKKSEDKPDENSYLLQSIPYKSEQKRIIE